VRRARLGVLLVEDHLLGRGGTATAVLDLARHRERAYHVLAARVAPLISAGRSRCERIAGRRLTDTTF